MYTVRETKTSKLRALRGPVPHALEHLNRFKTCTRLRLSGGQAPSLAQDGTSLPLQPGPEVLKAFTELVVSKSRSFLTDVVESPALDSQVQVELASRELTICELHGKLELSEKLASERALQMAEFRLVLEASINEMVFNLEKANTKAKEDAAQIRELKDQLAIANVQPKAELHEQLQADQELMDLHVERIQELVEQLRNAEVTIDSLQKQLKETTVQMEMHAQAEARLCQEVARMQQELEHDRKGHSDVRRNDRAQGTTVFLQHEAAGVEIKDLQQGARAEAQLHLDLEQVGSSQDLQNKLQENEAEQVTQQLATKGDEFALLCMKLKEEQAKGLSRELSLKLLQEQVDRFSSMRAELDDRNGALEKEIVRLKHELRKYAEIIVGNEGEPFYEVRHTEGPLALGSSREEKRETKASEEVPIPKDRDIASDNAQTRLSLGQEPDQGVYLLRPTSSHSNMPDADDL